MLDTIQTFRDALKADPDLSNTTQELQDQYRLSAFKYLEGNHDKIKVDIFRMFRDKFTLLKIMKTAIAVDKAQNWKAQKNKEAN